MVNRAFELIANELRNQYSISVLVPSETTARDSSHKIKVKVTAPDRRLKLTVRTRQEFYVNH
jgi:hypothetical protein